MSRLRILMVILAVLLPAAPALAQLTALARVDAAESGVAATEDGFELRLALSQPVPWRVFTLDAPRRLVLDLSEVIWPETLPGNAEGVGGLRTGRFQPGWSRLVLGLEAPFGVVSAGMETGAEDGSAQLTIRLARTTGEDFAASAGTPPSARFTLPRGRGKLREPAPDDGRLRVVLDPGHGGIDPGADAGEVSEADLMLIFARELRETLLRAGGFSVALTRNDDVFVPLERRIRIARDAGADVFLSLHADALPEEAGKASGASIYTLSEEASDLASRTLAERHDRADLLAGVDLAEQSDEIAVALMDLARRETEPRTDELAERLVSHITKATGPMNSSPRRAGSFAVLKAPDFPSVLVELGFLSSEEDRQRLADAEWRKRFAEGLRDGLRAWADSEEERRAAQN